MVSLLCIGKCRHWSALCWNDQGENCWNVWACFIVSYWCQVVIYLYFIKCQRVFIYSVEPSCRIIIKKLFGFTLHFYHYHRTVMKFFVSLTWNIGAGYQKLKPKVLRMTKRMTLRQKVLMKAGTLKMIQIGFGASARNHTTIVLWYVVTCVKTGFMASVSVSPKAWVCCLYIAWSIHMTFLSPYKENSVLQHILYITCLKKEAVISRSNCIDFMLEVI